MSGDPISLSFLVVPKCPLYYANKGWKRQQVKGVKISMEASPITHLLLANNTFLFFRADVQACRAVKGILNEFCRLSGQKINFEKSELLLSPSTKSNARRWFSGIFNVKRVDKPKYLSVKFDAINKQREFFWSILDKINSKLALKKVKCLSQGGRLTLIISILASLTLFYVRLLQSSKKHLWKDSPNGSILLVGHEIEQKNFIFVIGINFAHLLMKVVLVYTRLLLMLSLLRS